MEVKRYPVYASHVWEILAALATLAPFAQRRRERGENSPLDLWLAGFIEKLELLASVMIHGAQNGIVYFRKDDRELIEKLSNWVRINNVLQNEGVVNDVNME